MKYEFLYHFFPVGQGLFSKGSIKSDNANRSFQFLWVYDCGTCSSDHPIDESIKALEEPAGSDTRIDLLTLSHFDKDHISGVASLLKKFKVGILMLPYMPLAERLIIAFEEGGGEGDPLFDFYINPVRYLIDQEVQGIERILFVPPSGDKGPPYPGEQTGPPRPDPDDELKFVPEKNFPDDVEAPFLEPGTDGTAPAVECLAPGSALTLAKFGWEFIPYNDDPGKEIPQSFFNKVRERREKLLTASDSQARRDALKELKKEYWNQFGPSSKEKNQISLFLYSGPIYGIFQKYIIESARSGKIIQARKWDLPFISIYTGSENQKQERNKLRCSILYTGDGYLDTKAKLQRLLKYLDEKRVRRVGVFQVMHHGAQANWYQGTAAAIAPLFSVFSSDPEHKGYKHPHAPVLRDFWSYGAVQVDKVADFTAYGRLSTP
jgi:hypothetical protein